MFFLNRNFNLSKIKHLEDETKSFFIIGRCLFLNNSILKSNNKKGHRHAIILAFADALQIVFLRPKFNRTAAAIPPNN